MRDAVAGFDTIAHPAGPLVDGKRHCTACGLELPYPESWEEGDRVCLGPWLTPYGVRPTTQLDDDEVLCAGVVDVGDKVDA